MQPGLLAGSVEAVVAVVMIPSRLRWVGCVSKGVISAQSAARKEELRDRQSRKK